MNPHRTTDPALRAGHIADLLERQHVQKGEYPYQDWPRFWLDTYEVVVRELAGDNKMDCYYCAWRNGGHSPNCPKGSDPRWEQGQKDGRGGKKSESDDPVYRLGYGQGVVALEESENGYDPRFD